MGTKGLNCGNRMDKAVTIAALCAVDRSGGCIRVNRKFHTGMLEYVKRIGRPVSCVLPRMNDTDAAATIDLVELPENEVPYRVYTVAGEALGRDDLGTLERVVRESALVYCGPSEPLNWAVADLCSAHRVPYIVTTECTLRTELDIMRAQATSAARRLWGEVRVRRAYRKERRLVAQAAEVHANGYPTYFEHARTNSNRILYFDTRIRPAEVIAEEAMRDRIASQRRGERPGRLIYSGRYHAIKGTLDVVKAGIELLRRGVDFRLDLFGAGPLRDGLRDLVRAAGAKGRIFVNDAVPFSPDLLEISRQCDIFLCCHKQGDPSCTYLETFASGVPIVGYDNEMWSPLCKDSGGGLVVRKGGYTAMAECVASLLSDTDRLAALSRSARNFSTQHTMDQAWDLRCAGINATVTRGSDR